MEAPTGSPVAGIIVSHWHKRIENFQTSPLEFYTALEEALKRREIPEIALSRVEWKERGLMSARREYLRITRQRYFCDCCAAPFGTGFFFSSWVLMKPLGWTLPYIAGVLTTVLVLLFLFTKIFGFFLGLFLLLVGLFVLYRVIRSGALAMESKVEEYLSGLTIIGAIYDLYFRKLTYYEQDTAAMFQSAIHAAMLETVDAVTSAKGVRALAEPERKPIMREFFQR